MKYYVFGMWVRGDAEARKVFLEHMGFNGYKVDDTCSYNSYRGWLVNVWVPVESCEIWDINDKPGTFSVGEAKEIVCFKCGGNGLTKDETMSCSECRGKGYRYE